MGVDWLRRDGFRGGLSLLPPPSPPPTSLLPLPSSPVSRKTKKPTDVCRVKPSCRKIPFRYICCGELSSGGAQQQGNRDEIDGSGWWGRSYWDR